MTIKAICCNNANDHSIDPNYSGQTINILPIKMGEILNSNVNLNLSVFLTCL